MPKACQKHAFRRDVLVRSPAKTGRQAIRGFSEPRIAEPGDRFWRPRRPDQGRSPLMGITQRRPTKLRRATRMALVRSPGKSRRQAELPFSNGNSAEPGDGFCRPRRPDQEIPIPHGNNPRNPTRSVGTDRRSAKLEPCLFWQEKNPTAKRSERTEGPFWPKLYLTGKTRNPPRSGGTDRRSVKPRAASYRQDKKPAAKRRNGPKVRSVPSLNSTKTRNPPRSGGTGRRPVLSQA